MEQTQDLNISDVSPLIPPGVLRLEVPMTDSANRTVVTARARIQKILKHEDPGILAMVGPCSMHDLRGAIEYAAKLNELRRELEDRLIIIMRVYFEKPRTTVGWKGFLYDPCLDGSEDLATGLKLARKLLVEINERGLPTATELLDPITPQYIADLVSWAVIGARTTESQ